MADDAPIELHQLAVIFLAKLNGLNFLNRKLMGVLIRTIAIYLLENNKIRTYSSYWKISYLYLHYIFVISSQLSLAERVEKMNNKKCKRWETNVTHSRNSLPQLALTTIAVTLFASSVVQLSKGRTEQPKQAETSTSKPVLSTSLQAAIEELRVMRIKIDSQEGINRKEYKEDTADLVNIAKNAYGDDKALAAAKSALEGHKLAIQYWECDRLEGYEELHQCRDKALSSVFVKYPDIKAHALAAVAGENLPYVSAGLDENAVLQAIWQKANADTEVAFQVAEGNPVYLSYRSNSPIQQ